MDKMYPFRDCNMKLIEAIPANYKPDYSLELLERIERKRLGISQKVEVSEVKQNGEWLYQELKF